MKQPKKLSQMCDVQVTDEDAFEVRAIFILEKHRRDYYRRAAIVVAQRHGFLDGVPKTFKQIANSTPKLKNAYSKKFESIGTYPTNALNKYNRSLRYIRYAIACGQFKDLIK